MRSITTVVGKLLDLCFHFLGGAFKTSRELLEENKAAWTWCRGVRTFRHVALTSFCVLASGRDSEAARREGQRSGTGWLSGEPPALPDDPERRPGDGGLRSARSVRAVRSVFRSRRHFTAPCGRGDPANGNIWVCFDSTGLKTPLSSAGAQTKRRLRTLKRIHTGLRRPQETSWNAFPWMWLSLCKRLAPLPPAKTLYRKLNRSCFQRTVTVFICPQLNVTELHALAAPDRTAAETRLYAPQD